MYLSIFRNPVLRILIVSCVLGHANLCSAQGPPNIAKTVEQRETEFWDAYNNRDIEKIKTYLTPDVEFYHDKDGVTKTRDALLEDLRSGIFSSTQPRIRRQLIPGTLQHHEIPGFGAIVTGKHCFFVSTNGKREHKSATAQFTHVWQGVGDRWQMSRILSLDHQPAKFDEAVQLTQSQLEEVTGVYVAEQIGAITVLTTRETVAIKAPGFNATLVARSPSLFQHPRRDLSFEFVGDGDGIPDVLIIREHGEVVEKAMKRR